ncbi:MAG TPA: hypothetical protein VFZ69_07520 [Longimicrobiales bacterium]
MLTHTCPENRWHRAAVIVAVLFGVLSLLAGGLVLLGLRDPGHVVLQPLLIFNTVMGAVYVGAALRIRSDAAAGRAVAGLIALLNGGVWLGLIGYSLAGGLVAGDSVVAMMIRTLVWGSIYQVLGRVAAVPPVQIRERARQGNQSEVRT